LQYCTDILLAREDGAFELEEELYGELIEIYRSPQRLIRYTLPKHPRFMSPEKAKEQQQT